jgi:AcrR family transcriptional regulator
VDGRAARWTGQQQRRRAEFVEAALVAIRKHGADVSTEQIAGEAGVARTRLYRHFAGAHDLNQAIAARAEAMILDALAPVWDTTVSPSEIIRTAVSAHLGWLTENHELYRYLMRHSVASTTGDNVVNDVKRLISQMLIRLLDEYVETLGLDVRVVQPLSYGLVGFVDAAASQWASDPNGLTHDEMVDLLSGWIWSVLDGLLRDVGLEIDPAVPLGHDADG